MSEFELRQGWTVAKTSGTAEILDMGHARARLRAADLKPSEYPTIGAYFAAVREAAGFTVDEIAARTHIKAAYLDAIELMRLDELPSRPFALGFVKTYANALGVDAAAAVVKFKENTGGTLAREAPVRTAGPATEAVAENERPQLSLIAFLAVLGFILWCALMIASPRSSTTPFKLNDLPLAAIAQGPEASAARVPAAGATASAPPALIEARVLESVTPVYPRRCEVGAKDVETIEIAFSVTTAGVAVGERVAATTNDCFNAAALNTVRLWRFAPRTVDGAVRPAYDLRHVFEFRRPG